MIEVVDVPQGASEDEARTLLNRPCETNRYMLVQVFLLPSGATRAFYRLVSSAYDKKPDERNELHTNTGGSPSYGGNIANRDGQDDAARTIIKANSTWTVKALVKLLAESGIKRGKWWVTEARLEAREGGSKITSG